MNEAVDRLIAERGRLDAGLGGTFLVSIVAHLVAVGLAVALPALLPREPPLRVADGFAVVLPRGGGGSPGASPALMPSRPAPTVLAAPPPKVLKPSASVLPNPRSLPALDSRRAPRRTPEPPVGGRATAMSRTPADSATPGLALGPPGPGVPDGTDSGGDWYLAGVQQKIWALWNDQIRAGFSQPIGVTFTILPDGSVVDVKLTQPSGASLLDTAAQRAVILAGPFAPLPKEYGQNGRTIQALFRPVS